MRQTFVRLVTRFAFLAGAILCLAVPASAEEATDGVLSRDSVLRDPDIPALGNPDGDLTIVEFFDYQCPYCKRTAPILARVAQQDGKVRIVLKDWVSFGPVSAYAAKMALASKFQNKYAEAHDALIGAKTALTEASIRGLLEKRGIDVAKATADLQAHQAEIDSLLARNDAQAQAFGFQGTPAFIVGTFRVPGVLNEANLRQVISDARAKGPKD